MNRSFLFLVVVLFSSFTHAQRGTVTGTVKAMENGSMQPQPFANVLIKGQNTGASTDLDGKFSFQVEAGDHVLVVSFVGSSPVEKAVQVVAGGTVHVNIEMGSGGQEMQAVEVVKVRRTDTESAVIMETRKSMQVVNAIGSESISKGQDSDASEVMKRVPGVTVIGNNYIMIRGLSERYSNVQLHDVSAPSMEPDVRSFAFDIIPSSMIDRMVIYKSPAAELPGEFSGGVVKLYTKSIPDEGFFSATVGTTFREGSSMRDFLQTPRGFLHGLGLNDGYNDLPGGFPLDIRRVSASDDQSGLNAVGRSLRNNWVPQEVNSLMDRSVNVTNAAKFKLFGKDAGNITSISYSNAREVFDVKRSDYNAYDHINDRSFPLYDFNDQQFNQRIRTAVISNFALRPNKNTTLELKNLFTVFNTTQYVNRTGVDRDFLYVPDNHSFDQVYRGIYSGQLTGKHYWHEDRSKLTWTAGYGYSYRDQPDYRRYRSNVDTLTGESTLFVGVPLSPNYLGRFFSELRENSQSLNVAFEHAVDPERRFAPKLRTGVFLERRDRRFSARNMGYVRSNFMMFDETLIEGSIDQLFHPDNINLTNGIRIAEQSNPSDSYTANNVLLAGYVGADLPVIKEVLMLNTGLRIEHNDQGLRSALLTGEPVVVQNPILSVLPSVNLAYFIAEKQQLRLGYGRTVNRPEFRELAPFSFYDFNYNLVKKGSDSLRTPTIDNFDLRWEYYPSPSEMISVAVFHKSFHDPIESLFVPGGGSGGIKTFTYGNAKFARSTGVEVEVRRSLAAYSKNRHIQRMSLLFNASLIDSKVELGMASLGQSNERPLQGQSPYIVNAGLHYQNKEKGFQFNLVYNVIGKRIFIIGFDTYPDIYEMPRNLLDATASFRVAPRFDLKVGVGDVFNQAHVLLQDANGDGKYERDNDQVIQRYAPGRTWTAGITYRIQRNKGE